MANDLVLIFLRSAECICLNDIVMDNQETDVVTNPHDQFFRQSMANKRVAREFLFVAHQQTRWLYLSAIGASISA